MIQMSTVINRLVASMLLMALTGCGSEVYVGLSQAQANEMLLVLLRTGISAEKSSGDGGKSWALTVPSSEVTRALEALQVQGLPRERHSTLGDLFRKDGLISTPVEERVRFLYGTAQEISETLTRLDGVVVARVHVVVPDNDPLQTHRRPASASVLVKYRAGTNTENLIAPVKNLVAHSVEGLQYESVSVIFVPAETPSRVASRRVDASFDWALSIGVLLVAGAAVAWRIRKWPLFAAMTKRSVRWIDRRPQGAGT